MLNLTEKELIAQLQAGSLEALGHFYDRHQRMVYRTALAITGDSEAAADLLQEVFLRLFRFAYRIDAERPLEPWLYRMTTNLSYTWVKRSRRWLHPLEELIDRISFPSRQSVQDVVERNDEWEMVKRAISSLPLTQRVVVVLYYLDDLSLLEISEILEVPVGTVKSRLHYGRLALKKKLGLNEDGLLDLNFDRY
jgi:RNA polymerase sigma-70 factor, ECF subfamily